MADIAYWENSLVSHFVLRHKKERYRSLLKGRKKRGKFLDLLNHQFAYDSSLEFELRTSSRTIEGIMDILHNNGVHSTCFLMADQNELDGHEVKLKSGVEELLSSHWGALLICPPKPVVVYKPEAPSEIVFLRRNS